MMKVLLKTGILFAAFILISDTLQAQKIGYVNSTALVADLQETKQMQSNLEAFEKQLQKKAEMEVEKFKKEEQAAIQKKQRGEMTPKEEEAIMTKLKKMQEDIYAMGAEMEQQIAEKRSEQMQPILEKVNDAIKAVADEEGFEYILDSQAGVILYADEAADLTDKVKEKLTM